MRSGFGRFLRSYEERAIPLNREANQAYWAATTTGRPEDQAACAAKTAALRRLHSDAEELARLKGWQAGEPLEPLEARQLAILVRLYTEQQLAPEVIEELTRREQEIQSLFTSFRPEFEGRAASENDLRRVLAEEQDVGRRRAAWEASKRIGEEVTPRLLALAQERNRAARSLGFRDFFQQRLVIDELPEGPLFELLDDLERRTANPYARAKAELDAGLARRFGVAPGELRPWHYADPFFQEAPPVEGLDLDRLFSGRDVVEASRSFYSGLGLPVEDILSRSDLFERPGKNQHAYCIDMDRQGDVRVLANVRSNERWMSTMLHELGHASYSKHHDRELPFLLRDAAHLFTTEAVAMLMGRLTTSPGWLVRQAGVPWREIQHIAGLLAAHLRLAELIFVRWGLVVVRFERELYRDPSQDLKALWWDLVRRLQQLAPPEGRDAPDYASKIHLGTAPVYYQNYLLGTLAASQLGKALLEAGQGRAGLVGDLEAGAFLRERVFAVGARYPWNEMLRQATGRALSAEAFLADFAGQGRST
jgi:peptidyl-dipeptidase A